MIPLAKNVFGTNSFNSIIKLLFNWPNLKNIDVLIIISMLNDNLTAYEANDPSVAFYADFVDMRIKNNNKQSQQT